jgi:hypothetical protein
VHALDLQQLQQEVLAAYHPSNAVVIMKALTVWRKACGSSDVKTLLQQPRSCSCCSRSTQPVQQQSTSGPCAMHYSCLLLQRCCRLLSWLAWLGS